MSLLSSDHIYLVPVTLIELSNMAGSDLTFDAYRKTIWGGHAMPKTFIWS
jgi:hypothetical protein